MRLRTLSLIGSLGLACVLSSGPANAQDAQSGEFSVQRFAPAPGPRNFITVEGARITGKKAWSIGLYGNYSNNPFMVRSCRSKDDCSSPNATQPRDIGVIKDMIGADLLASFTPFDRLQIGLRVPFAYVNGEGIDVKTGLPPKDKLTGAGLGDPYLEGKFRLLGGLESPLVLGGALFMTAPVGHATAKDKYIGDSSVVVGGRGIADIKLGAFTAGGNVAGLYRQDATLGSTTLGPEFRYGVGVGYAFSPIFRAIVEGFGATKFSSKNGTNTLEIDPAIRVKPMQSKFEFTLGGGAGVIQGVGVPTFRGFLGLMYIHEVGDQDGDGLADDKDQCPTIPEDIDNFQDDDGCPDPDNDGDTIPDEHDKCPNQPETVNGFQDSDGCPDDIPDKDKDGIPDADDKCPDAGGDVIRVKGSKHYGCPDSDKDGVPDVVDKCPDKPEDTDGFEDEDGCPDPDNDGDGVLDNEDQCVDVPGSKENNGCPETDKDKDGIPDRLDKCPTQPENFNGFQDDDGCPDNKPTLVEQKADKLEIKGTIEFATDSDKITGGKSFAILDAVASLMTHNIKIQQIEIGGHTDDRGNKDHNKELSKKRAEACMKYLETKGVTANRMTAAGYGQEKPIADNKTAPGRQKNRRVEFNITKQAADQPAAP
ncbi:MAG: OmpA family protein [Deltaproteobacteria bacterium]|nr:OmpA family protein [Deltaproteobacteria bacterium]